MTENNLPNDDELKGSPLDDVSIDDIIAAEEWKDRKQTSYEDKIVRLFLRELGLAAYLPSLRRYMIELTDKPSLTLSIFAQQFSGLPIWPGARRIAYAYKDLSLPNLFKRFTKTRTYAAWEEVAESVPPEYAGMPVGLVVTNKVPELGQEHLILHNASVSMMENELKIVRRVRGVDFTIERLTVFLGRLNGSVSYTGG